MDVLDEFQIPMIVCRNEFQIPIVSLCSCTILLSYLQSLDRYLGPIKFETTKFDCNRYGQFVNICSKYSFSFERMKKSNQDPRKGRKLYQWRRIVINQPTSGPPCQGPLLQRSCPVAGPLIETDLALWGPLRETEGRYLQFLYGDSLRQQWFYCEVFHFIGKWATFYLR